MDNISIRFMQTGEQYLVSRLMKDVFDHVVTDEFSLSARQVFREATSPDRILEEYLNGSFFLLACQKRQIIGVIAIRYYSHISSLFVAPEMQGRGVAKMLWQAAFQLCQSKNTAGRFTVNASKCAVPVFEKFGFKIDQKSVFRDDSVYTPMVLEIKLPVNAMTGSI